MRGAVFFDVDGTLVPDMSSSQHLAGFLGHQAELAAAEDAYAAGQMDNRQVSVLDAAGWRGRRTSDIAEYLEYLPLVEGVTEVVAWRRDRDLAPIEGVTLRNHRLVPNKDQRLNQITWEAEFDLQALEDIARLVAQLYVQEFSAAA